MKRTLIPESQRISHAAQLFDLHFPLRLEPTVYALADNLSADYTGGYWHFYHLENHAFYLASSADRSFHLISPNGFQGDLSPDAFGVTICLFAYSNLCFGTNQDFREICADQFHGLRRYALTHPEAASILSAID